MVDLELLVKLVEMGVNGDYQEKIVLILVVDMLVILEIMEEILVERYLDQITA